MDEYEIDIRPMVVDKLVNFTDHALSKRLARIHDLLEEYQVYIEDFSSQLEKCQQIFSFLEDEQSKGKLAQSLKRGDVVRVVCPSCKGSGLKPIDATSGRITRRSAFEAVGANKKLQPSEIDPSERCTECQGKRWILMDRFKG
jgi:hypothetical protein